MPPRDIVALAIMKCTELCRLSPDVHEFALSMSCSTGIHIIYFGMYLNQDKRDMAT